MLRHENEEMQGIRVRGIEVTRLEGLTDAMIGFSVTLLIVSLEPPTSYDQLVKLMLSFPAFGVTFMLMMFIWYWNYRFFRQYGLNTGKVIMANAILMFVVLLFVFPLKFFATVVIDFIFLEQWFGLDMPDQVDPRGLNYHVLHTIYAIGFAAVFFCFAWLYKIAHDAADELKLTAYERASTKMQVGMYALIGSIPLLTILLVWMPTQNAPMIAGMSNFLIWPATSLYARMKLPKIEALRAEEQA